MNEGDTQPRASEPNVLRIEGVADITRAARLLETARERAAAPGDVVVDCSAVERLDASAVQVLLALKKKLAESGRSMTIQAIPERACGLLFATGAGQALAVAPLGDKLPPVAATEDTDGAPAASNAALDEEQAAALAPNPGDSGDEIDVEELFARHA